ncbi:urease accessory protein UreD, partial [Obelidium mucronatum]
PSPHRECKSRTVFLLSHGGGFVSGDAVNLEIVVEAEGVLSLLTQGSTKIFKKLTPTSKTRSTISAHVHPHSLLIILPEPVVPFAQSHFESLQTIVLESNASLVFLDWMVGGRVKMGGSARQGCMAF